MKGLVEKAKDKETTIGEKYKLWRLNKPCICWMDLSMQNWMGSGYCELKESWTWREWGLAPMAHASGWERPHRKDVKRLWDVTKTKQGSSLQETNLTMEHQQFLIGDTSSNGCFSVVMLVFGGVILVIWVGCWNSCRWTLQSRHPQMFETIPSSYLLKDCDFMRNHHFKATNFQLLAKNWWTRMMFRSVQFPSSPHPKKKTKTSIA